MERDIDRRGFAHGACQVPGGARPAGRGLRAELSKPHLYGKKSSSLRDDLDDPTKRPNARRRIAALRKERLQQQSKAG